MKANLTYTTKTLPLKMQYEYKQCFLVLFLLLVLSVKKKNLFSFTEFLTLHWQIKPVGCYMEL